MEMQLPPSHTPLEQKVVLSGMFVHVPSEPVTLQNWHSFEQAELQHTPSLQMPDTHSVPAEHSMPFGLAIVKYAISVLKSPSNPSAPVSSQNLILQ